MRVLPTLLAGLAVVSGALAVDIQKSVIVSFPAGTAKSVMDSAKADIKEAGGVITHEYQLINAFAAKMPQKITESVSAWSSKYNAVVEEDKVVQTYEGGPQ